MEQTQSIATVTAMAMRMNDMTNEELEEDFDGKKCKRPQMN